MSDAKFNDAKRGMEPFGGLILSSSIFAVLTSTGLVAHKKNERVWGRREFTEVTSLKNFLEVSTGYAWWDSAVRIDPGNSECVFLTGLMS